MNTGSDQRREMRVDPVCEHIFWRRHITTPLLAGQLRNVSESGISFRMHDSQKEPPHVGEHIQVKFLRHTRGLKPFRIMWISHTKAGLALGCARVSSTDAAEAILAQARAESEAVIAQMRPARALAA